MDKKQFIENVGVKTVTVCKENGGYSILFFENEGDYPNQVCLTLMSEESIVRKGMSYNNFMRYQIHDLIELEMGESSDELDLLYIFTKEWQQAIYDDNISKSEFDFLRNRALNMLKKCMDFYKSFEN